MSVSRRRFLAYTAALGGSAAAAWLGHRYLNPMPGVQVNRHGLPLGHLLRDRSLPQNVGAEHRCHTLILGSGAAGLSAAWYLAKHGRRDIVLAEGMEPDGNNAGYYRHGLGAPTAAHYLALPSVESEYVREMLRDFGILQADGRYRETDLVHAPEERLLHKNRWQSALLPQEDADSRRFYALIEQLKTARGSDGRKLFALPVALSSQDAAWRALDRLSFAAWLEREHYRSPSLRWYLDYCCRDDYGQGINAVSAFAGLHYFAARGPAQDTVLTWPDGLAHLSRQLRRHAGLQPADGFARAPQQPCTVNASALQIEEHGDHVAVVLRHNLSGETVRFRAQQVVAAMPLMVAARILADAAAYGFGHALPEYAPWLVANFVLHRFPDEPAGSDLAWDNVVHGGSGLGYVVATHQLIRAAKPERTIFTAYTALNHDRPQNVRRWLLAAGDQELLHHAARDLTAAYGRAFWRHVEHVDISVRAHGMSVPQPGYLNDPLLLALRRHRSRLHFAHSDLSSYSVFEEAVYWGVEAAKQILAQP